MTSEDSMISAFRNHGIFPNCALLFLIFRDFVIIIGVNKALLVVLIIFLPESKLWLEANSTQAGKTILERFQNIRMKPNQGFHRVSISVNNFFSERTANKSLPGLSSSSSSEEIQTSKERPTISILKRARRNSDRLSKWFFWLTEGDVFSVGLYHIIYI